MTNSNEQPTLNAPSPQQFTTIPPFDTEDDLLALLLNVVEQTADSIVITDINGRIVYVNPSFERITGYSRAEAIGQTPAMLKSGEHAPQMYAELWQAISNGRSFQAEFINRKKDGQLYYQEQTITPIKDSQGQIAYYVASGRDITDRKQVEQALRQRNEELATLHELSQRIRQREKALQTAVSTVNSTLSLNEVLDRILAEIRKAIPCDSASIILQDEDRCILASGYNLPPIPQEEIEQVLDCQNELLQIVIQTKRPLILADAQQDPRFTNWLDMKQIRGWLCIPLLVRDRLIGFITLDSYQEAIYSHEDADLALNFASQVAVAVENARLHEDLQAHFKTLRQAQERLVQSEKLAAVGELVAGVAHELNNPLAAVVLYAQLLQYKTNDKGLSKDLDQIVTQSQRASNIVRGLLDFARQRPPERKLVDLREVIDAALALVSYEFRSNNIAYATHYPPHLPLTMADSHQLQQVLVNLLNNARQAISDVQDQGHIDVRVEIGPSLYLGQEVADQQMIRIQIQDDGPGIPRHLVSRIFDPFFTTKPAGVGTGIGLSICHGIVAEHDGYIWAESTLGEGAVFWLEIPLVTEDETETQHASVSMPQFMRAANGAGEGRVSAKTAVSVLIIDDEASLRHIMGRALKKQGYDITIAADGQEGLDYVDDHSYDLILCDIRMPGMSGAAFYHYLQAHKPEQAKRIMFMTGDTITPNTRQFLQETAVSYLEKPFELEDLIAQINQFLLKRPA